MIAEGGASAFLAGVMASYAAWMRKTLPHRLAA